MCYMSRTTTHAEFDQANKLAFVHFVGKKLFKMQIYMILLLFFSYFKRVKIFPVQIVMEKKWKAIR